MTEQICQTERSNGPNTVLTVFQTSDFSNIQSIFLKRWSLISMRPRNSHDWG